MIKNLQAQVVPLVVYQDKETKKTVAAANENITKKPKHPDPLLAIDSIFGQVDDPFYSTSSANISTFARKRTSIADVNQQLDQKGRQNTDKNYFIKANVP